MDMIEINREMLVEAIRNKLMDTQGFKTYSAETDECINEIYRRIDNHPSLDRDTKLHLDNELGMIFSALTYESFENGLRIGLGLLANLLSGEIPEIRVIKQEPEKKAKRYAPVYPPMPEFIKYIEEASRYLSEEDKLKLMGKIDTIIENNREKTRSIF